MDVKQAPKAILFPRTDLLLPDAYPQPAGFKPSQTLQWNENGIWSWMRLTDSLHNLARCLSKVMVGQCVLLLLI